MCLLLACAQMLSSANAKVVHVTIATNDVADVMSLRRNIVLVTLHASEACMRTDARPSAAGDFTAGVDGKTGRYSVLGSFPAVESIHQAMHDYHSESEVRRRLSLGMLFSCVHSPALGTTAWQQEAFA